MNDDVFKPYDTDSTEAIIVVDRTGQTTWTWEEGRDYCINQIQSDYFIINTRSKALRLEALAIEKENTVDVPAWIGLTDEGEEGTWLWIDGSPTNDYENWKRRQPTLEDIPLKNHAMIRFDQKLVVWQENLGRKSLQAIVCKRKIPLPSYMYPPPTSRTLHKSHGRQNAISEKEEI